MATRTGVRQGLSEGAPHRFWARHRAIAADVRRSRRDIREDDGGPGGPGVHSSPRHGMHHQSRGQGHRDRGYRGAAVRIGASRRRAEKRVMRSLLIRRKRLENVRAAQRQPQFELQIGHYVKQLPPESEADEGATTAPCSTPAGCVKNEEPRSQSRMKWVTSGLPSIPYPANPQSSEAVKSDLRRYWSVKPSTCGNAWSKPVQSSSHSGDVLLQFIAPERASGGRCAEPVDRHRKNRGDGKQGGSGVPRRDRRGPGSAPTDRAVDRKS